MNKQSEKGISYLDFTWNCLTGCLHPCKDKYCYAAKIARRFGSPIDPKGVSALHELDKPVNKITRAGDMMVDPYPYGFEPTFHRYRLGEPAKKKQPSIIGVVYMGDLFGAWVPESWIQEVFKACEEAPQHQYLFLTKNPLRYGELNNGMGVPDRPNFWYGSTITKEGDPFACVKTPMPHQSHYFVSIEPLLQGVSDLTTLSYVDWVILGQQTGPGSVPPEPDWVEAIISQCRSSGVPVFVKRPLFGQFPIQEWPDGLRRGVSI